MRRTVDTIEVVEELSEAVRCADSAAEVDQATLSCISGSTNADLVFIAEKQGCGLDLAASDPSDWDGTDGLLSPVSIPARAISQDKYSIVDDRADTRSVVQPASTSGRPHAEYRSLVVSPLGSDRVVVAAGRRPSEFSDEDVALVRLVAAVVAPVRSALAEAEDEPDTGPRTDDAAAVLSHDAANFLHIIYAHLELARDDPSEANLQAIRRATDRLEELIEDTSTLLREGSRFTDVDPHPLEAVATQAWQNIDSRDADLVVADSAVILADRSSLSELFENLFQNAVEHAGPSVTVRVGVLPDGFYVEDDGPGLDTADDAEVFGRGVTGDAGNQGLGLAIVARIVDAHGWEIACTESESGGARFEVTNVEFPESP